MTGWGGRGLISEGGGTCKRNKKCVRTRNEKNEKKSVKTYPRKEVTNMPLHLQI